MHRILFFIVSFAASLVGAICGIGGGVVIKPVLDAFHILDVATISFLSSCTVLSMSCYSVAKGLHAGDRAIDLRSATPLGIGAALGGILGSTLFAQVKAQFANPNHVGAIQAACLLLVTLGTLLYTLRKHRLRTHRVQSAPLCALIGLLLGVLSSFLGIGGGPINLVVLGYFFSMPSKTAAQNSLYIILISQAANLLSTIVSGRIPPFEPLLLALMIAGGITGGMLGRRLHKKMDGPMVDRLFVALMLLIMGICCLNIVRYA